MATIGREGFERALAAVRAQDVRVRVLVIRDVAPISSAYQAMLEACETEFYVHVDEDVELEPHAVRTLYEELTSGPDNVAVYGRTLFDTDLERPILALKIYRRSITHRYPYRDVIGSDRDQSNRMAADGFPTVYPPVSDPRTLGRHGIVWTPWSLYERYGTLWEKMRRGSRFTPMDTAVRRLFERHLEQGSENTFFAVMGPIAAALKPADRVPREKNFHEYGDNAPGWTSLRAYFQEANGPEKPAVPQAACAGVMETFWNRPSKEGLPDLSERVSVHMTTVGRPGFEQSLAAVRAQDVRVRVTVIRDAAPISAAYQAMLDDCETDYYIQVDDDVELNPDAVRTLHAAIESEPGNIPIVGKNLFDTHAKLPIRAVKIHRRSITERYPYRDVRGCDLDQQNRMAADGHPTLFQALDEAETAGRHGIVWTPWSLYERYFTLWEKLRGGSPTIPWMPATALKLFDEHLESASERTFYPLMGVLAAALGEELPSRPEKDFRRYGSAAAGWNHLTQFFEEMTAADPGL